MRNVIAQDLSQAVDNAINTSLKNVPDFADASCSVTWCGGETAGTQWRIDKIGEAKILQSKINMPTLPANASLSRYEADVMTGFAIHEMGHNICTDIDVWKEVCAAGRTHAQIMNSFEDPRMELDLLQRGHFAGAKHCLELLTENCVRKSAENGWHPAIARCLTFSINTLAYVEMCGYDIPSAEGLLENAGDMAPHIRMWVDKLKLCKTSADVWALTQEFIAYYPAKSNTDDDGSEVAFTQQDGSVPADTSDTDQSDTDQSDTDTANDSADADVDTDADADADEELQQYLEGLKGQSSPEASNINTVDADAIDAMDQMDADKLDSVENLAQSIADRDPETKGLGITDSQSIIQTRLEGKSIKSGKIKATQIRASLPKTVGAAKQRITRMLTNPDRRGELRNRDKGRLDTGRLHRLSTGSKNVFTKTWKRSGYKTAVGVLIDNSGSMHGYNNHDAVRLGYVLGDAMSAANIKFSVASFPAVIVRRNRAYKEERVHVAGSGVNNNRVDVASDTASMREKPLRYNPDNINVSSRYSRNVSTLKPFNVQWSKSDYNLSALYGHADGGTPMTQAIFSMASQMRSMDEDKKVIFVLTDGGYGSPDLAQVVKLANRWGIKVVSLEVSYKSDPDFAQCMNANVHGTCVHDILTDLDKLANELA